MVHRPPLRAALLLAGLLVVFPRAAGAVDLAGTWHVLVHYKEAGSEHPEREHWEDRLWVFEQKDGRLEWTEYPIVVFDDETGRFERLGTNRASRVLSFWEPSPGQLEEIRRGLQYNPRGSKTKTLRGTDAGGWTSGRSGDGYQSARVLTYEELWRIDGLTDRPVFRRDDSLVGGGAEEMEGRTVWETESREEGGQVLRGRYERDGVRAGRFVMRRSGTAGIVRGSGKTQAERVYELFLGEMAGQVLGGGLSGGVEEAELRRMIETKSVPDEVRAEVRREIRASVEQEMERQGNDPRALRPQVDELTARIERMYLDEGRSLEEIRDALAGAPPVP
jgi:hypothetical protein